VLAEKPSVARDLARVLGASSRGDGVLTGNGYVVTWAIGHLVGLEEPEGVDTRWRRWSFDTLPMLPSRWPLRVFDSTRAQFEIVRRALSAKDVTNVICATDAGREGELIFRFIYEAAACRLPVKRLWISSLTDGAIRDGLSKLRPQRDFDGLAAAALGRSRADWLVGMNLSRAYGLSLDQALSVGRVQTPTLALLVERELQIRDFVPEDFLEVVATFAPNEREKYQGVWHRDGAREHPRRLPASGEEANAIVARAKVGVATVAHVTSKQKKLPPPLLYDLTELQRHANRLYGFSAQRTLELAQTLYEQHKLISYPRTDSRHLSSEVHSTLKAVTQAISKPFVPHLAPGTGTRPLGRRFVDDTQVSDHHAILPTAVSAEGRSLSVDEARVYELVCRRLLQAWHDDFIWAATQVTTEIATSGVVDRYLSHGTAIEHVGWKVLDVGTVKPPSEKRGPHEDADDEAMLPAGLTRGQVQQVLDAKAVPKRTRPPPRLNDATLLTAMQTAGKTLDERELSDAMKENGLGTPATRANIIETLLTRAYIVREGKGLVATEKGIALIAVVDPEVKSAAMTGAWEARLQRIAKGDGALPEFIHGIERYVESVIGRIRSAPPAASAPTPSAALHHRATAGRSPLRATSSRAGEPLGFSMHRGTGTSTATSMTDASFRTPNGEPAAPSEHDDRLHEIATHSKTHAPLARITVFPTVEAESASLEGLGFRRDGRANTNETGALVAPQRTRPHARDEVSLLKTFGHASYRPHQREACEAVIEGNDVLLVMPTGAGKSLCYQLPGLARGGTTLVVSPLIALMEDQVSRLKSLGLAAERIHSGRPRSESRRVCADYLAGRLDYLFVAPERLSVAGFPELLSKRTPSLIAIDEAHCISQWGHDFRPDYRLLGERLPSLRPSPVMALTATATPLVQRDIIKQLGLRPEAKQLIHGFRRHNLGIEALEVLPKERPQRALQWLLQPGRVPAIVYAPTRKSAEATAEVLSGRLRVAPYHAGLSNTERDASQTAFLCGDLDVIVATVAFGMGVDKADVRTVLHLALPGSVEGYYQEIGRAGRDGKPSRAVLMHHFVDRKTHEFFFERDYPDATVLSKLARALSDEPQDSENLQRRTRVKVDDFEKALEKLWIHGGVRGVTEDRLTKGHDRWQSPYEAQRKLRVEQVALMAKFAEGHHCRMLSLVKHFGDQTDDGRPCGSCDICAPASCIAAHFEAPSSHERTVMSEILARLRAMPGLSSGKLCREMLGDAPEARRGFERLVSGLVRGGQLRVEDAVFVKDGQSIPYHRLFAIGVGEPAQARLTPKSLPAPERQVKVKGHRRTKKASRLPAVELPTTGGNAALVEKLRAWRLTEAKRRRVPAFRVLTNRALVAVAEARPTSQQALLRVKGLGQKVVQQSGRQLIELCQ
jgi:DNA topoisomerase III